WRLVGVQSPNLAHCVDRCMHLGDTDPSAHIEAILIDLYRYMERLLIDANSRSKAQLGTIPLACFGRWVNTRPIFYLEDRELRAKLAEVAGRDFWTPPCDVTDLVELTTAFGLVRLSPVLTIVANRQPAFDAGDSIRQQFRKSVDQLSNELARNDPST